MSGVPNEELDGMVNENGDPAEQLTPDEIKNLPSDTPPPWNAELEDPS